MVTNLPAQRYPLDMIYRAYKWRWQVELLFKEWKSYANLHGHWFSLMGTVLPFAISTYAI